MVVGHDVSVLRDDHARSCCLALRGLHPLLARTATGVAEEAKRVKESAPGVVLHFDGLRLGVLHILDVDHGGQCFLGGIGQIDRLSSNDGCRGLSRIYLQECSRRESQRRHCGGTHQILRKFLHTTISFLFLIFILPLRSRQPSFTFLPTGFLPKRGANIGAKNVKLTICHESLSDFNSFLFTLNGS